MNGDNEDLSVAVSRTPEVPAGDQKRRRPNTDSALLIKEIRLQSVDSPANPAPADIQRPIPGPVNTPGLGLNRPALHESPETGIHGIIPVVAHAEIAVRRHSDRSENIPHRNHVVGFINTDVVFFDRFSIPVQLLVTHLNDVTRNADDTFDEGDAGIPRILKNDDIAPLRSCPL